MIFGTLDVDLIKSALEIDLTTLLIDLFVYERRGRTLCFKLLLQRIMFLRVRLLNLELVFRSLSEKGSLLIGIDLAVDELVLRTLP